MHKYTKVTQKINFFLLIISTMILGACGDSATSSDIEKTGIKFILDYHKYEKNPPQVKHYQEAGIENVNDDNIHYMNELIKTKELYEIDTVEELQDVVNGRSIEKDTTKPIISLNGLDTMTLNIGDIYTEEGATVVDNMDKGLEAVITGKVDTNISGSNTIYYNAEDKAGNKADKVTRKVTVQEKIVLTIKKPWEEYGKLSISDDGHMLQYAGKSKGFFFMGDTAWLASRKLDKIDIDKYLKARKEIGFNVILISAVQDQSHPRKRAVDFPENGQDIFPFKHINEKFDFKSPNIAYWEHIDYIIDKAAEHGMYIALLPSWNMLFKTGVGLQNTKDAEVYARWIAQRYKDRPNIIWVVGGDSGDVGFVEHDWPRKEKIWNAMGNEIHKVVGEDHLITYHPTGVRSSSQWFGDKEWLDFNMIQSGHCDPVSLGAELIRNDYNNSSKPVIDGEARYETILECFYKTDKQKREDGNAIDKRFTSRDIRDAAYTQLFSGAFGYIYGHHSIWQFWDEGKSCCSDATETWEDALYSDGAKQMKYVVNLMKSRPILNRIPDKSLLVSGKGITTRGDGYIFAYLPEGGEITINLGKISGKTIEAWWYNPQNGDATVIGTYDNNGSKSFDSLGSDDTVLVIDNISKGYMKPSL